MVGCHAVCLSWVLLTATPVAAAETETSSGRHCLEEPRAKLYVDQTLLSFINPTGPEHHLNLTYCRPLITTPGLLFDYTNLQVGVLNILSPVYVQQGGFLSVAPLSVLQVRAEIEGVYVWPINFDSAGHYPRSDYGDRFGNRALRAGEGETAHGYLAALSATIQGQIALGPVELIFVDTVLAEYWSIGDASYYFNLRRDLILARQDWVLMNSAVLLVGWRPHPGLGMRVGLMDDLGRVPGGDYVTHRIALLATASIANLGPSIRSVDPFVSVGLYTHHALRQGQPFGLVGIAASYDWSAPPGADSAD